MQEARLYQKLERNGVRCLLCGHRCVVAVGKRGVCQVRENVDGTLYTLVYNRAISQHADPVEKKPLYHFYPGSLAYSIATQGCNFQCPWCQNWQIAQAPRLGRLHEARQVTPGQIVESARRSGSRGIAYTYTEPTVFYEYTLDTARLAHQAGLANIYVTNGYMSPEMLEEFHSYLDAANVDLKSFRKRTYQRLVKANLDRVLESLKRLKDLGVWVEVTTLVIPGINDDPLELRELAAFIADELGIETPWHISRFFPMYRMSDRPPTPEGTLRQARDIGQQAGLRYVYVGNTYESADTNCHHCGQTLIGRWGYRITEYNLREGRCAACGTPAAGVW